MLRLDKISRVTCDLNGYPTSFLDKCFKKFLDRLHIIKFTLATVEIKPLRLITGLGMSLEVIAVCQHKFITNLL